MPIKCIKNLIASILFQFFLLSCTGAIDKIENFITTASESQVTIDITNKDEFEGCVFSFNAKIGDVKIHIPTTSSRETNIVITQGNIEITVEARKNGKVIATGKITQTVKEGKTVIEIVLVKNSEEGELVSIAITGGNRVNVGSSSSTPLVVMATYSDNSTLTVEDTENITWQSSAPSIASITDGIITGVSKGTATITATYQNKTATTAITVGDLPDPSTLKTIEINGSNTLIKGGTTTLSVTAIYEDNTTMGISNNNATWSSSNGEVAVVSTSGVVTAKGAGNVVITVSYNGKSATHSITITDPMTLTGIKITGSNKLEKGDSANLTVTATYSNGETQNVTSAAEWSSSNEQVVSVSNSLVTALSEGTANITANYNGYSDYITITVAQETKEKCITPTISATTGTTKTKFELLKETDMSVIYYTLDGSIPTTNSTVYSTPFTLPAGTHTVKAIAAKVGMENSDVMTKTVTVTDPIRNKTLIFVKASSAPTIWIWEDGGKEISTLMGYSWDTQPTMESVPEDYMNDPNGWYQFLLPNEHLTGKPIAFILNKGSNILSTKTKTFWYDNGTYYDEDPTTVTYAAPEITISPKDGASIKSTHNITIVVQENNSALTSLTVSVGSKNYNKSDFIHNTLSIVPVNLGYSNGDSLTVRVSAANAIGSTTKSVTIKIDDTVVEDKFTWDNALVYFVMTDRFYDGNSSNNTSYGRVQADCKEKRIGTFHGGDIAGLTQKIDYLDELGVNAVWITAPYEQIHGWVGGGSNGDFAHYAYHGYYVLDYTMMDKNMGTVEEFRTFVTEAHKRGIRVVMDIVMNHTGYENLKDMETYGYGSLDSGKSYNWLPSASETFHQKPINKQGSNWDKFWGKDWIRGDFNGYSTGGGDLQGCLSFLPDFKTESTSSVSAPPLLQTKWAQETSGYDAWIVPAAKNLRKTLSGCAPADYLVKWLASWVEEFGIDGFRCDTAKHIEAYRWKQLKEACKTALNNWRNSSKADNYAKTWDEDFWMTGECFPWHINGDSTYYNNGFDSMIDFTYNAGSGKTPPIFDWKNRADTLNGTTEDGKNALIYVSSHDTSLHRPSDMKELGTNLILMPGGVQIFYGDETARSPGDGGSDTTQGTRSDFNWSAVGGNINTHWKKIGSFRKNHPAVGAGKQTDLGDNTYGRSYNGAAGEDKVVIKVGTGSVKVSGFFTDGTTVRNAYDNSTVTVSGGYAPFTSSGPILVEEVK